MNENDEVVKGVYYAVAKQVECASDKDVIEVSIERREE